MNLERRHITDTDVENLLSPRCDFRTSPDFMDRLREALPVPSHLPGEATSPPGETSDTHGGKRKMWWILTSAAAAVAALFITAVAFFTIQDAPAGDLLAEAASPSEREPSETQKEETPEVVLPHIEPERIDTPAKSKSDTPKQAVGSVKREMKPDKASRSDKEESARVTGAMPLRSQLHDRPKGSKSFTTEKMDGYLRMVHTAYIESVRDEIARNEAMIQEIRENNN